MSAALFDPGGSGRRRAPLADRMRPRSLDEFVGQEHLVGEGRILRRLARGGRLPSMIFWGPPGTGKTTLARILAGSGEAAFFPLSAVSAGVADLRKAVAEAHQRWAQEQRPTVLFIDEIHRFNKAQQDAILPAVEEGTLTLMGATTENPSFEVIGPLLSRSRVFTLKPLAPREVGVLLERALADVERGLGGEGLTADADALEALASASAGDARMALTALEIAAASVPPDAQGRRHLTRAEVDEALQHRTQRYDARGEAHYDTISAYIKSVRGSDVDAALYWLARMIDAGEDPLFLVRRMVILAAEDIGLADPRALMLATACQQGVHFVGMPEGALLMAECTIYLAAAPKSNSATTAIGRALEDARTTQGEEVPLHLRNAPTWLLREMGYGKGYRYAHDFEGHFVEQRHLPESLAGRRYWEPGSLGFEHKLKQWYEGLRRPEG